MRPRRSADRVEATLLGGGSAGAGRGNGAKTETETRMNGPSIQPSHFTVVETQEAKDTVATSGGLCRSREGAQGGSDTSS